MVVLWPSHLLIVSQAAAATIKSSVPGSSKGALNTVKITKAIKKLNTAGKAEFTPLEVGYLGISSSTANVWVCIAVATCR